MDSPLSSEGLGAACCRMPAPCTWRIAKPRPNDQHGKRRVRHCELPKRCLVEEKPVDPVLDEADLVPNLPRTLAQPRLSNGEHAVLAEPGLNNDDRDGREVAEPKPEGVHPRPANPVTNDYGWQAANNEEHNGEVKDEHCVRKCGVG